MGVRFKITDLITSTLALVSVHVWANSADDQFFQSLQTSSMTILTPAQCSANMANLADPKLVKDNNFLKMHDASSSTASVSSGIGWIPTGAVQAPPDPNCTNQKMWEALYTGSPSAPAQSQRISQFFNTCGAKLNAQNYGPTVSLIGILTAQYDVCNAPRIRNVVLNLPDGTILRGLLAMQDTTSKRPIVIAKGGVFASTGDLSHKLLLMHLFDEGVFNVLVLSSSSSPEFIRDNTRVAVGGYEEGMELIRVAELIKSSPIGDHVSSYHIAGLSLGGNASLFASHYNELYNSSLVSSFMSICPVVDLQTSMNDLFGDAIKGPAAKAVLDFDLSTIADTDPQFQSIGQNAASAIPGVVAQDSVRFFQSRGPGWELPVIEDPVDMATTAQFWAANNFLSEVPTPQQVPHFVIAAQDDWIVNASHNTGSLMQALAGVGGTQLAAMETSYGNHCAFDMAYGWGTISNFYRTYFLSHSADLQAIVRRVTPANLDLAGHLQLLSREKNWSQTFKFASGSNQMTATFNIWTGQGDGCHPSDITQASTSCVRTVNVSIPISQLPSSWAKIPENDPQAQSLTRWANTNLSWKAANGSDIFGTAAVPSGLSWIDYQSRGVSSPLASAGH